MSIFSPIDYKDPAAAERLAAGRDLLGRFSQNYHRVHRLHIVEGPVLVDEGRADAEVVDALEGPAVRLNAEGEVDARHRRIRAAEAAVAAARETMPGSADQASIEDIMDLAA